MECDLLGLHLAVLHIYLVATEDDGDVLAHPAADTQAIKFVTRRQLPAACDHTCDTARAISSMAVQAW